MQEPGDGRPVHRSPALGQGAQLAAPAAQAWLQLRPRPARKVLGQTTDVVNSGQCVFLLMVVSVLRTLEVGWTLVPTLLVRTTGDP